MNNPYIYTLDQILGWVVEYRDYFEENLPLLAYLMAFYDDVHYGSRHDENEEFQDWTNPKDALIDLNKKTSEEYVSLVYDAWCYETDRREELTTAPRLPEEHNRHKTMEDWVNICSNPQYRYHSLYPSRISILDYFLCTLGAGNDWTKEGYIAPVGPNGTDMTLFYGAENSFLRLPHFLRIEIADVIKHPIMGKGLANRKAALESFKKEREAVSSFIRKDGVPNWIADEKDTELKAQQAASWERAKKKREDLEAERMKQPYDFYPMSEEYSLLCTMPHNAHISYIKCGAEICHLILAGKDTQTYHEKGVAKEYPCDNHKIAKKFLEKWKHRL